jgi:hypothetical protein
VCLSQQQFSTCRLFEFLDIFDCLGIVSRQVEEIPIVKLHFLGVLGGGWGLKYCRLELLDIFGFEISDSQTEPGLLILGCRVQECLTKFGYVVMPTLLNGLLDKLKLGLTGTFHWHRQILFNTILLIGHNILLASQTFSRPIMSNISYSCQTSCHIFS